MLTTCFTGISQLPYKQLEITTVRFRTVTMLENAVKALFVKIEMFIGPGLDMINSQLPEDMGPKKKKKKMKQHTICVMDFFFCRLQKENYV